MTAPHDSTKDTPISAQVSLSPVGFTHVREVTEALTRAGFDITEADYHRIQDLSANDFSITANQRLFQSYFRVELDVSRTGGVRVRGCSGEATYDLPLEALPAELRDKIDRVFFTRLPDFGPTGNY